MVYYGPGLSVFNEQISHDLSIAMLAESCGPRRVICIRPN